MGNDQPISSVKEAWHSQELGINLLAIRSGPVVGKQTFTIVELDASEPDPQLFELPNIQPIGKEMEFAPSLVE